MTIEGISVRRRLPIWAIVKRSYGYVWGHRRLLAAPLFLVFLAQLCCTLYIRNVQIAAGGLGHGIIWKIYAINFAAIVSCCRSDTMFWCAAAAPRLQTLFNLHAPITN